MKKDTKKKLMGKIDFDFDILQQAVFPDKGKVSLGPEDFIARVQKVDRSLSEEEILNIFQAADV